MLGTDVCGDCKALERALSCMSRPWCVPQLQSSLSTSMRQCEVRLEDGQESKHGQAGGKPTWPLTPPKSFRLRGHGGAVIACPARAKARAWRPWRASLKQVHSSEGALLLYSNFLEGFSRPFNPGLIAAKDIIPAQENAHTFQRLEAGLVIMEQKEATAS